VKELAMSSELRAAPTSRSEGGGPSEPTIDRACAMMTDTTNGVSAVKIERVALDAEIQRLVRAVADRSGVRLVLKPRPTGDHADLMIEQAIAPIHHQPRAECPGLLAYVLPSFWPRFWSNPSGAKTSGPKTTSRVDAEASAMRDLR
jgi:hypothetical protein